MRSIVAFLVAVCVAQPCLSWSEGGHHLIAEMAFDDVTPDLQTKAIELLKSHPRFAEDFKIPEKAGDPEHYLIGRAAYWPDVARSQKEYNRPKWHYQLGAVVVLDDIKAPDAPGPLPDGATMDTQDLHIMQAVDLCRKIVKDKSKPVGDRAIALCWVLHLVGDAHQPCHSGSLYSKEFPDGDRGANEIPTVQGKNMHALWDGLLGPKYDAGDIKRRAKEIQAVKTRGGAISKMFARSPEDTIGRGHLSPRRWIGESASQAELGVYESFVLKSLKEDKSKPIDLPAEYLQQAGDTVRMRAALATWRLAEILRQDLAD